jgi:hypothetical protein
LEQSEKGSGCAGMTGPMDRLGKAVTGIWSIRIGHNLTHNNNYCEVKSHRKMRVLARENTLSPCRSPWGQNFQTLPTPPFAIASSRRDVGVLAGPMTDRERDVAGSIGWA